MKFSRHHPHKCSPEGERRFARPGHWLDDGSSHGHGRRGGSGRGRLFGHGDLRLLVLHLLQGQPRSGYEIIRAIEELVGGLYSPSPGVVYPTLTLLEEQGQIIVSASDGPKKTYSVTPAGSTALEADSAKLSGMLERMQHVGATEGREPPLAIRRAMENVKTALRLRFAQGTLTPEQADAMADALDAAARTIEKV